MKKTKEKKEEEKVHPCDISSILTFFLSRTLPSCLSFYQPIFLPAFIPKIRQIYFSVNRVEYNQCWARKREKRGKKEKKKRRDERELREIYIKTIFVSKKRCVEQNAAHEKTVKHVDVT